MIAISSVGRRVELVKQFKKTFPDCVAIDNDKNAPALYIADRYVSSIINISHLIESVQNLGIEYIISLNDTELYCLSNFQGFKGIRILHPEKNIIKACRDKALYSEFFDIQTPPTTIIKDRYGSGGSGCAKIAQPYIDGEEYNIQAYFCFETGNLIDVFIQKKIKMRDGETDKSVSVYNDDILKAIVKLQGKGFTGATDIDVIVDDKIYIIDINPRFGGGYPLAHKCGKNYIQLLKENLTSKLSKRDYYNYETGLVMMKYPATMYRSEV